MIDDQTDSVSGAGRLDALMRHVLANENWLMERILSYAKARDYAQYTSTLVEAWRVSIQGLSEAVGKAARASGGRLPGFSPDERLADDPAAVFGILEARLHRGAGHKPPDVPRPVQILPPKLRGPGA